MLVEVFRAACLLVVPFLQYQNGKWKRLSYVLNWCVKIKRSVVDEYGKRERLTPPAGTLTNIYFAHKEICKKSQEPWKTGTLKNKDSSEKPKFVWIVIYVYKLLIARPRIFHISPEDNRKKQNLGRKFVLRAICTFLRFQTSCKRVIIHKKSNDRKRHALRKKKFVYQFLTINEHARQRPRKFSKCSMLDPASDTFTFIQLSPLTGHLP